MTQLTQRPDTPVQPPEEPPSRLAAVFAGAAGRRGAWVVLAVWVLVAVGTGLLAPRVYASENNSSTSSLPPSAQSSLVNNIDASFPGANVEDAVVVFARPGGLSAADLARARRDAAAVLSDGLAGQRPAQELQVSRDGTTAFFSVTLAGHGDQRVRDVQRIRALVGEGSGGLDIKVTGQAAFDADEAGLFNGLDSTLLFAAAGIVAILLLIIYRSPFLWLLPLVAVGLADFAAQSLVYLLVQAGLTVNSQTLGIMTVLVFGVGTDYALLLVSRYREELHQYADPHVAMVAALRGAAPAITASGATVAASLLCLLTSVVPTDRSMGPVAAIGVVVAVIAMLTALPALLVVTGRRVFWPYAPRYDRAEPAWEAVAEEAVREAEGEIEARQTGPRTPITERVHRPHLPHLHRPHLPHGVHLGLPSLRGERRETMWLRVGRVVLARPRLVWSTAVAVLFVMCLGLLTVSTSLPASKMFRGEVDSASGQQLLDRSFPSGTGTPLVVVVRPATDAPAARRATATTPGIASTGPVQVAGNTARFTAVMTAEDASPAGDATVYRLRDHLTAEVGHGALVGGQAAMDADTRAASLRDLKVIVPLVLLVVLLVLAVLLRAVVAPLMLLGTVVLSFGAALGVSSVVFGSPLFKFVALDPALPLFAFIFLVALGCDYNIFLMARAREEARSLGTSVGVVRALAATGGVITSAGVVLAGTFLVLDLLPVVILAEIGFVVAFGVLLDTFLVRTVLVPALSIDLGARLWWPSWLWRWERAQPPVEQAAHDAVRTPAPAVVGGDPTDWTDPGDRADPTG